MYHFHNGINSAEVQSLHQLKAHIIKVELYFLEPILFLISKTPLNLEAKLEYTRVLMFLVENRWGSIIYDPVLQISNQLAMLTQEAKKYENFASEVFKYLNLFTKTANQSPNLTEVMNYTSDNL